MSSTFFTWSFCGLPVEAGLGALAVTTGDGFFFWNRVVGATIAVLNPAGRTGATGFATGLGLAADRRTACCLQHVAHVPDLPLNGDMQQHRS